MKETLLPLTQAIVALQIEVARLHTAIEIWKQHHPEDGALIAATLGDVSNRQQISEAAQQKIEFLEKLFHRMHEPPQRDELQGLLQAVTLGIRY